MAWKVLEWGDVPEDAAEIDYECPHCGREAPLPVVGMALAQISGGGVVFDVGRHAMPAQIRCTKCRREFTLEDAHVRQAV